MSNSSSSSFVCSISGEAVEVQDLDFKSSGLARCSAGHVFKEEYLVNEEGANPTRNQMLEALDKITDSKKECNAYRIMSDAHLKEAYDEKVASEGNYCGGDYPVSRCPICTMNAITDADLVKYFLKENNMTRMELVDILRTQFNDNIVKFQGYINKKK